MKIEKGGVLGMSQQDIKYENVKGVLGMCQRDGQIRNNNELKNIISEKGLVDCNMGQLDDEHSDYIWCLFYDGELSDDLETTIYWIINNDMNRSW